MGYGGSHRAIRPDLPPAHWRHGEPDRCVMTDHEFTAAWGELRAALPPGWLALRLNHRHKGRRLWLYAFDATERVKRAAGSGSSRRPTSRRRGACEG